MKVKANFGWYKGKGAVFVTSKDNEFLAKHTVEVPRKIDSDEWYDGEGKLIVCDDCFRYYNREMGVWEEVESIDAEVLKKHGIEKVMTIKHFLGGINFKMS